MGRGSSILFLLALPPLASASLTPTLIKSPDVDSLMVSERGHGIQLFCSINRSEDQSSTSTTTPDDFFTGSGSTLEGESETSGITWFRRDEDSDEWEAISEDHVTLSEDGRKSALYIKEADAEHGDYRCVLGGSDVEHHWKVLPHFKLLRMEKSMEVVQGEDMKLYCRLHSASIREGNLRFLWSRLPEKALKANVSAEEEKDLTPYVGKSDIDAHIKIAHRESESVLKLEDAVYSDRAVYRCKVTLERDGDKDAVHDSTQTLVRVKDKYAALYPFIGIVAEVIALALIIFLCERGKGQGDVDDEDDDNYTSTGGSNRAGNSGNNAAVVRQRKP